METGRCGDEEIRSHSARLRIAASPHSRVSVSPHLRIALSPSLYVPSDSGLRLNHESVS